MNQGPIQEILSVNIDTNALDELKGLEQIKVFFADNKNLIGLNVFINGDLTPIHLEHLFPILAELDITHLGLVINSLNVQDPSKLFSLIPQKKWSSIHVDAKLSDFSLNNLVEMLRAHGATELYLSNTTLENENFQSMIGLLHEASFHQLQSLKFNFANITCLQAIEIVKVSRNYSLLSLDLGWNMIRHVAPSNEYGIFCQSIVDSQLNHLTLSSATFNDIEAKILADALTKISRRFHLCLTMSQSLTADGIRLLTQALNHNSKLTITLEDPLNYALTFSTEVDKLNSSSMHNKTPSLVEIAAKRVSCLAKEIPLERLPFVLIETLPPINYQQRLALEKLKQESLSDEVQQLNLSSKETVDNQAKMKDQLLKILKS